MLDQLRSCIFLCSVAVFSLASPEVDAQESRGTLQGRVVDASGAAVPGATVEVLNLATGVVSPTMTNEQGSYRAALLNPGNYRVTVSLTGFGKFISDKIELHVADVLTVDATLRVGAATDEVRGPGYAVLDLSLLKNVSLGGSRQFQFRVEAYNALNRANLQNPNTTTTSTALGTITAQNGLPRQLQIAAKVSF